MELTAWSQLRTQARHLLKDVLADDISETPPRWTDAELLTYANAGIDDLSVNVGWLQQETVHVGAATGMLELPPGCQRVQWVVLQSSATYGNGVTLTQHYLPEYIPRPGTALLGDEDQAYLPNWPEDGQLSFVQPLLTSETIQIIYAAWRPHLTNDVDLLPFGRQAWMNGALLDYICFLANMRDGVGRASLEQWSAKPQNVVGNPLVENALTWLAAYERKLRNAQPNYHLRFA